MMSFSFFTSFSTLLSALVLLAMYVIAISFMVWMVVDAAKNDKFWWLVFILMLPFIGALLYYFTEKKKMYSHEHISHVHHKA